MLFLNGEWDLEKLKSPEVECIVEQPINGSAAEVDTLCWGDHFLTPVSVARVYSLLSRRPTT